MVLPEQADIAVPSKMLPAAAPAPPAAAPAPPAAAPASRLAVETEAFGRLPAWAQEQLHADAERLAGFLGCALAAYSVG